SSGIAAWLIGLSLTGQLVAQRGGRRHTSRAHCTMPRHPMSVGAARRSKQWAYSGSARDAHEGRPSLDEMTMTFDEPAAWRRGERDRLIAARDALDAATIEDLRRRLDAHLERSFPGLAAARLGFCWPIRNEYDARPLAQRLRGRGAVTALPVVVAPRQPLV